MSGTSTFESREERAIHEAGHFVFAWAYGWLPRYPCIFVTLEPRKVGDVVSGGSIALTPGEPAPYKEFCEHCMAGLAAQVQYSLLSSPEKVASISGSTEEQRGLEFLKLVVSEATKRFDGSHSDIQALMTSETPDGFPPYRARDEWLALERAVLHILNTPILWPSIERLASGLLKQTTLFRDEAELVLLGDNEQTREFFLIYRELRKKGLPPPPEWLKGATEECPAGPWCESPAEFRARVSQVAPP